MTGIHVGLSVFLLSSFNVGSGLSTFALPISRYRRSSDWLHRSRSACACPRPPYAFFFLFSSFLKKGIKNTRHPAKKKQLPNIDQKLPILAIQNPTAETVKRIHPKKLIVWFFIYLTLRNYIAPPLWGRYIRRYAATRVRPSLWLPAPLNRIQRSHALTAGNDLNTG